MSARTQEIPLVDLRLQHLAIAQQVEEGWAGVLERSSFVLGEEVARFEEAFAAYCGVGECVGVANGTDALELVLRAVGLGARDEVILPTNSFVATAEAVRRAGAKPVLVDVDPRTYLIDPECVAERLGAHTRAIIPVHLYGQVAPVSALHDMIGDRVSLVEDAAQAQGATHNGVSAGALGFAAATSFYPGKNLGAYGDAGAVLTSVPHLADTVRQASNHGSASKYEHPVLGFNSRLDTLQAVVLLAKLAHLSGWNEQRREAAARYDELLADLNEVVPPSVLPGNEHVWHLYVVRVPRRDEIMRRLGAAGIHAGIHYPVPIHLLGGFADLGHRRGDFPNAERAAEEILSLPMYPGITEPQQERVVAELRRALR